MIPKLAHSSGINPAYLSIQCCRHPTSSDHFPGIGRGGCRAGMAKISPFEVVKRTSVPVLVGLLVVIIATEILVPGTTVQ
ncbi:C4-dicarboxylate transporter DcuC [Raoultella terrigena]|uniref:C4-dicarboxylate transporter DcuC n=1 Tax=Raoultella terrigena TaxID=577 RepID=A0A3P8KI77_RAOTE|nr:C4-dicarboxylate transporter DcuC [Raoultella terrigena]